MNHRRIHDNTIAFFFVTLFFTKYVVAQENDDSQTLLELKQQLVDPLNQLSSWEGTTICHWQGITCGNGTNQVTGISLPKLSLQGSISPAIGNLKFLQALDLSMNNLTGSIPEAITNCTSMRDLNLGQNKLTGNIPSQLGHLTALEFLRLHQNGLQGSIPNSIGFLKNLRKLRLHDNQLTGTIPREIGNCSFLGFLELYDNQLEGEIPTELGNLPRLSHLSLFQNKLSGRIPSELSRCRSLQRVTLSNNNFEGGLFTEIGALFNLQNLIASNCGLSGPFPSGLENITGLLELDLSSNGFLGSLSDTLGEKWQKLTMLNLSVNSIDGRVPTSLGGMVDLQVLDLSFNKFSGFLPSSVGLLPNMTTLLISSNSLQGGLPPALGNSSSLSVFNASNNGFSGSLPSGLCSKNNLESLSVSNNSLNGTLGGLIENCASLVTLEASGNAFTGLSLQVVASDSLTRLDISSNQMDGVFPVLIRQLTELQYLLVSGNQFIGHLPDEVSTLTKLIVLDISHNLFDGELPDLSTLSQLKVLDVSDNKFSGIIRETIGTNLPLLETMDFSNNNFSGSIPQTMQNLEDLQSFNFSDNHFDGSIPQIKAFVAGPASAFLNNPGLCGAPLPACSSPPGTPSAPRRPTSRRNRRNRAGRTVGLVFVVLTSLVIVAGAIFLFCSHRNINRRRKSAKVQENRFADRVPMMYAEAEKATEGFSDANVIGIGPNGKVYKAIYAWEKILAVKVLNADLDVEDKGNYYFTAAARKLNRIRHPNVVQLEGFIIYGGNRIFLYEYMPNKSLGEVLHATSGPKLHWNTRYKIALGAAQGLSYLHHQASIIHCDIKSNNIMLDSAFGAHIGDVGLAKLIKDPRNLSSVDREFGYSAPEAMRVSLKADVYSFGVVLLELLTGRRPFLEDGSSIVTWVRDSLADDQPLGEIVDPILRNANGPFHEEMATVCKVALACTDFAPNRRPTMKEVVDVLSKIRQVPGGPKLRSLRSFIHRRSFILLSTSEHQMDIET